jgi:hypothetical protein
MKHSAAFGRNRRMTRKYGTRKSPAPFWTTECFPELVSSTFRQLSDLTAEFAEERRETRRLCASLRPLRFVACSKSHGSNADETQIKDEKIEQEQTERVPKLRFLCYRVLTKPTADFADTRGWADHLVRVDPRVSAPSAVFLHNPPD